MSSGIGARLWRADRPNVGNCYPLRDYPTVFQAEVFVKGVWKVDISEHYSVPAPDHSWYKYVNKYLTRVRTHKKAGGAYAGRFQSKISPHDKKTESSLDWVEQGYE